ncbi:hypothetical protein Glove_150g94 [Diversispora epigaea]|uniref:t-SNARE coiled-coil homology domain-containing protein n=1 Tax=Diversispora epigaea TaxID=1348612 RepID=A0A397IXD5_9GLOM|nr:hypothetical protein Glove_150g94 [Diversispora epigaea]
MIIIIIIIIIILVPKNETKNYHPENFFYSKLEYELQCAYEENQILSNINENLNDLGQTIENKTNHHLYERLEETQSKFNIHMKNCKMEKSTLVLNFNRKMEHALAIVNEYKNKCQLYEKKVLKLDEFSQRIEELSLKLAEAQEQLAHNNNCGLDEILDDYDDNNNNIHNNNNNNTKESADDIQPNNNVLQEFEQFKGDTNNELSKVNNQLQEAQETITRVVNENVILKEKLETTNKKLRSSKSASSLIVKGMIGGVIVGVGAVSVSRYFKS